MTEQVRKSIEEAKVETIKSRYSIAIGECGKKIAYYRELDLVELYPNIKVVAKIKNGKEI